MIEYTQQKGAIMDEFSIRKQYLFPSFELSKEERHIFEKYYAFLDRSGVAEIIKRHIHNYTEAGGRPSVNYYNLFVSQKLDTTVNRHILDLRLEKSKYLLEQTDLPVSEIARQCGFAYSYYFIRLFREKYGRTALESRKAYRAGAEPVPAPAR